MRRVDEGITPGQGLGSHPVLEQLADGAALWIEENQAVACQLLDAEQVELLAELAMVALLGLLQALQILIQLLFRKERGTVDALQALALLVSLPVGAGDREQLESFDLRSGRHVRAAAEIDE